ncbi:MAG: hypothetical protein KAW87_08765, partial [Candidatus Cloacimonetes bacterium]|nr:hypothetical protein [Candidatus Cloacimonadota bacterium]
WSYKRMMAHRDEHSKSFKSAKKGGYQAEATWETDEEFMGIKTMVIQVLKLGPKSTEMVYALSTEPGAEGLKERFKDESPLNGMSDMTIKEAEIVKDEAEGKPVAVNKQTGEVEKDITAKEKEEIERAVNAKEGAGEDIPGSSYNNPIHRGKAK